MVAFLGWQRVRGSPAESIGWTEGALLRNEAIKALLANLTFSAFASSMIGIFAQQLADLVRRTGLITVISLPEWVDCVLQRA